MDPREFYRNVQEHQDLEWLGSKKGETPAEDEVFVGNRTNDYKLAIPVSELPDHTWEEFEMICTARRRPDVISKLSRIVGYYSNMRSWNKSKLAEMRDRQKGNYGLSEEQYVKEEPRARKKEPAPAREPTGV